MKKLDNLLRGLRLIITKELAPVHARLSALEVENATLRGELAALRSRKEQKASVTTPAEMAARYETIQ